MKQKILIVSDTYYPKVDGTVKFIEEFLKRASRHFDIRLLVPNFSQTKRRSEHQTTYLDLSTILRPLPSYPSIKLSISNLRKIKQEIQHTDIVFVQGPALVSLLAIYLGKFYNKKVIFYTHVLSWELLKTSSSKFRTKIGAKLLQKIFAFSFNRCTKILLPYPDLKATIKDMGVKTPIEIAKLGVDIHLFSSPSSKALAKKQRGIDPESFVIGYLGRISPEKNTKTLVHAFQNPLLQGKKFLLIVGDGPSELKEELHALPHCRITGFVSNPQDYLKAMDVFVMPSLTETTSLATLEAMASGLPILSTKVGFIQRYIIRNYNGLFFAKDNPPMLALKLEQLRKNQALREELGTNARKTSAYSFSWERSINRIIRILSQL